MKRAILVVLPVVALFSAIELFVHFVMIRMSKDLGRYEAYAGQAYRLHERGGTSIALIGNSTTDCGIDPQRMEGLLRDAGVQDATVKAFPVDGSGITTWYYLAKNYFIGPGLAPRIVVVNYNRPMYLGGDEVEVGRLAQYFAFFSDWREVLAHELSSGNDRCEFILSWFWKTFAFRSRLRSRVLSLAVYHNRDLQEQVNKAAVDHEHLVAKRKGISGPADYSRLERFLKLMKQSRVYLIVAAIPERPVGGKPAFEIDPRARTLIESYGFAFKDLRATDSLQPAMYKDEAHLNDEGRRIYTTILSKEVVKEIKASAGRSAYTSSPSGELHASMG